MPANCSPSKPDRYERRGPVCGARILDRQVRGLTPTERREVAIAAAVEPRRGRWDRDRPVDVDRGRQVRASRPSTARRADYRRRSALRRRPLRGEGLGCAITSGGRTPLSTGRPSISSRGGDKRPSTRWARDEPQTRRPRKHVLPGRLFRATQRGHPSVRSMSQSRRRRRGHRPSRVLFRPVTHGARRRLRCLCRELGQVHRRGLDQLELLEGAWRALPRLA